MSSQNVITKDRPFVIEIDTSNKSDMFSSVFGKRIDEDAYSSFLEKYNDRPESPKDEIEIVLTTEGGDMTYSVLIANVLVNHRGKTIATVPKYAFSGGTVIALMCDEIRLCPNASLGPIDLQVFVPVKSVIPSLVRWVDKNWICSTVHGLLTSCQRDYINKLKSLLEIKYKDPIVVKGIIDFFYFKFKNQTPLFRRDMPDFLAHKFTTTEKPRVVKTTSRKNVDFLMNLMSDQTKRLHGPSTKSDSESSESGSEDA